MSYTVLATTVKNNKQGKAAIAKYCNLKAARCRPVVLSFNYQAHAVFSCCHFDEELLLGSASAYKVNNFAGRNK